MKPQRKPVVVVEEGQRYANVQRYLAPNTITTFKSS